VADVTEGESNHMGQAALRAEDETLARISPARNENADFFGTIDVDIASEQDGIGYRPLHPSGPTAAAGHEGRPATDVGKRSGETGMRPLDTRLIRSRPRRTVTTR
jgi:hypothetical protein